MPRASAISANTSQNSGSSATLVRCPAKLKLRLASRTYTNGLKG